jgi:hypothetical protein
MFEPKESDDIYLRLTQSLMALFLAWKSLQSELQIT